MSEAPEPSTAPQTLDQLGAKQRANVQRDAQRLHDGLHADGRGKKDLMLRLAAHPRRQLIEQAYKEKWGETPQETYDYVRATARARKEALRTGFEPPRAAPPVGAWRKFNAFLYSKAGLKSDWDFTSSAFDQLKPTTQDEIYRLIVDAKDGFRSVASDVGITVGECMEVAQTILDRNISISQFKRPGLPSPRTQLKLEAIRDKSLTTAGLKQPMADLTASAPPDVKYAPPHGVSKDDWDQFHTALNKVTNRLNARERAITASEFGHLDAMDQQKVVDVVKHMLLDRVDHVCPPGLPRAVRKKIANEMIRRIKALEDKCH